MSDTTEIYIKMSDCPKIQDQNPFRDWAVIVKSGCFAYTEHDVFIWQKSKWIWLPRQDQLQAMVIQKYELARGVLHRFVDWERENSGLTTKYLEFNTFSMEQLWLAFVMKEKYNKVWNGEEWR